jgi:hypothetical protein
VAVINFFAQLHLCAVSGSGNLWHTIRKTDGQWTGFGDVEGQAGERGQFVRVGITEAATGANGSSELHVCGVTTNGRLWHSIRRGNGQWTGFGDVEGQAGERGSFVGVDCAGIGTQLHVTGITADGRLWHSIRKGDGQWTGFGDVEGQTGDRGTIVDVACARAGSGGLHVCAVSSDGHLWHSIRKADGQWTGFGDVEGQAGERGSFVRVSAGFAQVTVTTGVLHVCGVTADGRLWHSIRKADGQWTGFGDVEGQAGERGSFRTVSADAT